jgi:hypothetical protein
VETLIEPSVEEKLPLVQAIVDSHHHEDPAKEKNKVRFNVGNNGNLKRHFSEFFACMYVRQGWGS